MPISIDDFNVTKKEFAIKFPEEFEKIQRADFIIINGEGTIVNDLPNFKTYRRSGRYTIFMAHIARSLFRKPSFLLNFTFDPNNSEIDLMAKNIFPSLDGVFVREHLSLRALSNLSVKAEFVPDALFHKSLTSNLLDSPREYAVFGDTSAIKYTGKLYFEKLGKLINKFCDEFDVVYADGNTPFVDDIYNLTKNLGIKWINPRNTSVDDLFKIFKKTKFYFSGRWHNSILAACAGCPIVTLGSDSFKTLALRDLFDNEISYVDINNFLNRSEI